MHKPRWGQFGISSTGMRKRILKALRAIFGPNELKIDLLDDDLKPFWTGVQNIENKGISPRCPELLGKTSPIQPIFEFP